MEAGTSLTPANWLTKPNGSQLSRQLPQASSTGDTSDSDAETTFRAPSGRLNQATISSSPSLTGQTRSIFRVSPASNRSPQSSFRLRTFGKASSGGLAEDSVSLSNRSDSSCHQDHLAEDVRQQTVDRRSVGRLPQRHPSAPQLVPRSAGRTRSPQRVAPAPGDLLAPAKPAKHIMPGEVAAATAFVAP